MVTCTIHARKPLRPETAKALLEMARCAAKQIADHDGPVDVEILPDREPEQPRRTPRGVFLRPAPFLRLMSCPNAIKKHRVAIFEPRIIKDKYAVVAFSVTDQVNGIGVDDPTQEQRRRYYSYETEAQALDIFNEIIAKSVEAGSRLLYNGPKNSG